MAIVEFTARDMGEDLDTPHTKLYKSLTLAQYNEIKAQNANYANQYDSNRVEHKALRKRPVYANTNKPSSEARAEQEQAMQGVTNFNSTEQDRVKEASGPKVYRTLDKKGIALPPHLDLDPEEIIAKSNQAVDRLIQPSGVPELKKYEDLLRNILKMFIHTNLVDNHIILRDDREKAIFDYKKIEEDAIIAKEEQKHFKKVNNNLKELSKEFGNLEFKPARNEALIDLETVMYLAREKKFDALSMNRDQKKFYRDILKPMAKKVYGVSKGEKIFNSEGELDYNKLSKIYTDTKRESLEKERRARFENNSPKLSP